MLRGKIHHGYIRTSCHEFADAGAPWDSRVRIDIGLSREPARAVTKRDGLLHPTNDEHYGWADVGPVARPKYRPDPKPDPEAIARGDEARRRCNRVMRANKARIRF